MTDAPILGFHDEYRFLSNFWFAQQLLNIGDDGLALDFQFNEKWYMVHKTLVPEEANAIMACKTPGRCKRLGRHVTLRPDWEEVKDGVMLEGLRMKFVQNPDLAEKLVATGKRYLEETNDWHDTYWGVCDGTCKHPHAPGGMNMLGISLMRVRAELA